MKLKYTFIKWTGIYTDFIGLYFMMNTNISNVIAMSHKSIYEKNNNNNKRRKEKIIF